MIDRKTCFSVMWAASVLVGLYLASLYSYLLFHSLAEMFGILVAVSIAILTWNSRRFLDNTFLLFIGIAYLFIGLLDLLHTLAYEGMGVFQGGGSNLATQLWISTRYVESISLLLASFFLGRKLRVNLLFLGYTSVVLLILGSIFTWDIFPQCFAEGTGLTPFKKMSEYVICLILGGSIAMLLRKRLEFDTGVIRLLIASIVLTIGSELAFTLYVHAYGLPNLIGHYLKIASFYFIYRAIIQTGLRRPYALLFRNLKRSEEELRKSEERFRQLAENIDDVFWIGTAGTGDQRQILYVSPQCEKVFGIKEEAVYQSDRHWLDVVHEDDRDRVLASLENFLLDRGEFDVEYRVVRPDGSLRWIWARAFPIRDEKGQMQRTAGIAEDVTERKRAAERLKEAHDALERRVQERTDDLVAANRVLRGEIEQRRQVQEELRESEAQLRRLSTQLLQVQEDERKRIARELHDGIGQSLAAAKFTVERALGTIRQGTIQAGTALLDDLVLAIQRAIEEVRKTQMDLRPPLLDDLGIVSTVSWFCREFQKVYSHILVETKLDIEERSVPRPLKIIIFRVLQEALNNIAKHSRSRAASISLSEENGRIELVIKDDGHGFDVEQAESEKGSSEGFGLTSMKERIELSGGSFSIESTPGKGTKVGAVWQGQ